MGEHENKMKRLREEIDRLRQTEKARVRSLGSAIGYGRLMQLAEEIWDGIRPGVGEAYSVGCCTCFLVECPHEVDEDNPHCDWCCGSGRVTKRVAQEIEAIQERKNTLT